MKKVVLNRKISNRVVSGHPWIFSNEIDLMDDALEAGDIADVYTYDHKFVGRGYFNPVSMIPISSSPETRRRKSMQLSFTGESWKHGSTVKKLVIPKTAG